MAYSEKVLDHYTNPQNVGTLDKTKSNVGTGLVGAPECGDVMRLQIEVDEAERGHAVAAPVAHPSTRARSRALGADRSDPPGRVRSSC